MLMGRGVVALAGLLVTSTSLFAQAVDPGAAFLTLIAVAAAACHSINPPPLVQPGAPGRASHVVTAERAVDLGSSRATAADVAFMQEMIGHHAQAVEMVALLNARTTREDMRLLGLKIEVSQSDEIRMMQRWLEARGQPLPGPHAHHERRERSPARCTMRAKERA